MISVAAAVVGGVIAVAHARATAAATDDEGEAEDPGGILAEVARILNQAAAEQDVSSSPPPRPRYAGDVSGYWRYQCLNPRGHAAGNCRHEWRWVNDYTKGAAEQKEEEDAEA
ncbi:hypothetical protein CEB94_14565 [Streptomyces hawaiiensis]|uniref:Uncharacterized protein n=1 Tax=Streptomyces hawaiiensis TaxID=67305 RepID=A0A6G5RED7_9ACTN|nr:hypothetical protein CEB94_14565 [Streptomyces hawaiiensis]